ncbi:hypothetical protein [Actinomadura flavalba]|nr:hypothetical protein [Actinomadura flavalba]
MTAARVTTPARRAVRLAPDVRAAWPFPVPLVPVVVRRGADPRPGATA